MPFYEIEFPLASLSTDALDEALLGIGALSITYEDGADHEPVLEPKPGEIRLWRETRVRALFEQSTDPVLKLHELGRTLGASVTEAARVRAVADQAWERAWLDGWKSMRFGRRLWICPTSAPMPADPEAVVVRLDPGLAFGTGSHPTTALCLQIIDHLPLRGRSVIDYGCGSGILGLAALKLGASEVIAVDIDSQALTATRANAARNGIAERMRVQDDAANLPAAFCVLANILAGPLIDLATRLTAACQPGGYLVLSGMLRTQAHAVKAAYSDGFEKIEIVGLKEWCAIYAHRGF